MEVPILFEAQQIRCIWHNEEWFYVLSDVVLALTASKDVKQYIKRMRGRDKELFRQWEQIVLPLEVQTKGGKQKMGCANTQGIFRIIQSIPSPKAEPFKQWLSQVGYERLQEIENPELAAKHARKYYADLGYSDSWIDKRLQAIAIRTQLTDEWKERDIKAGSEYTILTAEIAESTFGIKPKDHKALKDLNRESLRDHMTNLELIFTMLGEEATRSKAVEKDAQGFLENKKVAKEGGTAAGKALEAYENETGDKVVSPNNFKLQIAQAKSRKKLKRKKK